MKKISRKNVLKITGEASAFKKIISRGNVIDVTVGVIVGGAFLQNSNKSC